MIEIEIDEPPSEVILKIKNLSKLTNKSIRRAWFKIGRDITITANRRILDKNKTGSTVSVGGTVISLISTSINRRKSPTQ